MAERPETIENRWDILYRDYPEVYDAFSSTPYLPSVYDQMLQKIDLTGKTVADVGAGSGISTCALARCARNVIGIDREPAMLQLAASKQKQGICQNASFMAGDALALALANASVDVVTGITLALWPASQYREFIREGFRTAREQVIYLGIPPGWYGGELNSVIGIDDQFADEIESIFINEFQASFQDIFSLQEYGSLEHILATYGFIFGKNAIEFLKRERKTSILWKFRMYTCKP